MYRAVPGPIDLETLRRLSLQRTPYEWACTAHAIPTVAALRLSASFPGEDFWQVHDEGGAADSWYAARPLLTMEADTPFNGAGLDSEWHAVARQIKSDAYRDALATAVNQDLSAAKVEATLWKRPAGVGIAPHTDLPCKILTQVFYFNTDWTSGFGGSLHILGSRDPDDVHARLDPELGSAALLVRSKDSWHSVTPITKHAISPRLSMNVTWFVSDGRSPVWSVDDAGRTSCILPASHPAPTARCD